MPLPQTVSHTLQAVTLSNLVQITVRRLSDNSLTATGYFELRDEGGVLRGNSSVTVPLSGASATSLASFANTHIIPAMNAL